MNTQGPRRSKSSRPAGVCRSEIEPLPDKDPERHAFRWSQIPWLIVAIGVSLAIGFLIPPIYELGLKPASRSKHPGLVRLAVLSLIVTAVFCLVRLSWRRTAPVPESPSPSPPLQFRLREMFGLTALLAVIFSVMTVTDEDVANGLVAGWVTAVTGWTFWCVPSGRRRLLILLAVIYLPFVWTIAFNEPFGTVSGLAVNIPLCPGILVAELLRGLIGLDRDAATQMAAVLAMIGIGLGAVLARRGGKTFVCYTLAALASSSFSSFVLQALFRF